jgi:L-lactate dehydrogenase complex protein LldE
MVTEKAACVTATKAQVLIGSDSSCLMNLGGRLQREGRPVRVMHTAELLWEGVKGRG